MKRNILPTLLAVILIIVSTTAVALAHEEDEGVASRTKPFMIQERRGELKEDMEAKREAFGTRMEEFRKEKIGMMIGFMKRRFTAAIERLRNIAERIDGRIAKIEDETGKDLSEASALVDQAHEHIDAAEDLIDGVSTSTATSLLDTASTTGNRFGMLRELFTKAKKELQTARELLGQALRAIGGSRGTEKHATTTSN